MNENLRKALEKAKDDLALEINRVDSLVGDEGDQSKLLGRLDEILYLTDQEEARIWRSYPVNPYDQDKIRNVFRDLRNRCADLIEKVCNGKEL